MQDNSSFKSKVQVIGRNLRYFRNQFGITQNHLSSALNISRQTISAFEKGTGQPNLKTLNMFADYFGMPLERFLIEQDVNFCVITCDVVNSRAVLNRSKLQKKIASLLRNLNREYSHQLVTKFNITLGDEFQGVCSYFSKFLDLYLDIRVGLLPYSVSIGIGLGPIGTKLYKANSHKMDGPAFHYAREMIDRSKSKGGYFYIKTAHPFDAIINLLLDEVNHLFEKLTPKEINVLHLYFSLNNQIQVAELLEVSQGYVSRILKQTKFDRIKTIMEEIEILINSAMKFEKAER